MKLPANGSPDPSQRISWLIVCIGAGLLAGLLLSSKLWLSSRFYPLTPVWLFMGPIGRPFDAMIFGALLILLAAALAAPKLRTLLTAFVLLAGALALMDQSRWQPWFYQYLFMLIALSVVPCGPVTAERSRAALDTCRLIVAGIYFWSGLQKANVQFIDHMFPWIVEPFTRLLPSSLGKLVGSMGVLAPIVEAGIGIGLLTTRYRHAAVVTALAMHVGILFAISPVGHDHNPVVWPWNVAMGAFAVILFWRSPDSSFTDIVWTKNFPFQRVALALFGIAPLLSFFNLWDNYLSSALYSGNRNVATVYMKDSVAGRLPDEIQKYVYLAEDGSDIDSLEIADWSFGELNVPPYPEVRIFKNVARMICRYAREPSDVKLVVRKKVTLFQRAGRSRYDCSSLSKHD